MHYYHNTKNAESYTAMCEGYDAAAQLGVLSEVLPAESAVLELGSGPGNDLELLAARYHVTGSDYSPAFVDILKARFPDQSMLMLDAITIATEGLFDAIYSNKVLHHLTDDELATSFHSQAELLTPGSFVFHLVWRQLEAPEEDHGLIFKPRDVAAMTAAMGSAFELLEAKEFGEFEYGDSLAILARKI
jgi:trans-aconitate methyltransferase